jgi:8-oxo-dGTP pyrophosphatase MutT (NUDIX family)
MAPSAIGPDIQVLMLRRPAAMKFAPGAYVFPGGSVDPADSSAEIPWYGPEPAELGARLGASAEMARALVGAAVRETFEESGVLFAGAPGGGPLARPSGPDWETDRAALNAGSLSLGALLAKHDLVLRADLLVPWTRWITPIGEPRRFDARFFVAELPPGQQVLGHEAEADKTAWLRPAAALEAAKRGEIMLLPPTATTLNDFAQVAAEGGGVAGILTARRTVEPIQPHFEIEDGETWLVIPDEAGCPL